MSARIKRLLDRTKAEYVTCAFADLNGNLRGHFVSRKQFEASLGNGLALLPEAVVLGVNDEIFFPEGYLSFDMPFADEKAMVATSDARHLPDYPSDKDLFFFLDFPKGGSGNLWAPRQIYARAESRLGALGLIPIVGCEYEFRIIAPRSEVPTKLHRPYQRRYCRASSGPATPGHRSRRRIPP